VLRNDQLFTLKITDRSWRTLCDVKSPCVPHIDEEVTIDGCEVGTVHNVRYDFNFVPPIIMVAVRF
jgi:hypothetical protein